MRDPFSLVYIYLIFAVVVFFLLDHVVCGWVCAPLLLLLLLLLYVPLKLYTCASVCPVQVCKYLLFLQHTSHVNSAYLYEMYTWNICLLRLSIGLARFRSSTNAHTHTRAQTGDTHSRSISVFLCIPQKGEQANLCNKNESAENKNLFYFMVTDINTFM